ncbi:hypothetical protein ABN77_25595 [Salmonella enterica subsp. salamae]|nr:hypothetical protein [Salmonella enterica subsp. salamae]EDV1593186.1 hypothetical protein [Salmonella enterica subsp. salamae]
MKKMLIAACSAATLFAGAAHATSYDSSHSAGQNVLGQTEFDITFTSPSVSPRFNTVISTFTLDRITNGTLLADTVVHMPSGSSAFLTSDFTGDNHAKLKANLNSTYAVTDDTGVSGTGGEDIHIVLSATAGSFVPGTAHVTYTLNDFAV